MLFDSIQFQNVQLTTSVRSIFVFKMSTWRRKHYTLNNLTAIGVHDIAQKRAVLLHYAGIKVFEVFDTLLKAETGDVKDYDKAT